LETRDVVIDSLRVRQILLNLIGNALKFTENGEIKVILYSEGTSLCFRVEDTGIGIENSLIDRVFERFTKLSDIKNRRPHILVEGTGLGLSISKGLVELMGGTINVTSEIGKGSCFCFQIPFEIIEEEKISISYTNEEGRNIEGNWTILIAEDDDSNYLYLMETLLDLGPLKILHARNGQEAVNTCDREHIDVILMDIKMPIMGGYAALKKIKSKYPNISIIAQTAHAMSGDDELALAADFDDYISKPINAELLLKKVKKFII
jgi:CheY-like chemotaxis protein